jgi:hypothetical protein
MTTTTLTAALTNCSVGLYPLEAAVALLIDEDTYLHRDDFTSRFIEHGTSGGTPMAAIDWDAAITALNNGELPCSAGERRTLAAAASIAAGIPVDLRDTATGLDDRNIQRLITAIRHASGRC